MTFSLPEGLRLRDKGIAKTASNNADWLAHMRATAVRIAQANGVVTTDDLRRYANKTGKNPANPNAWGAIFRGFPVEGYEWRTVGFKPSAKETNHGRRIAVWRLMKRHG